MYPPYPKDGFHFEKSFLPPNAEKGAIAPACMPNDQVLNPLFPEKSGGATTVLIRLEVSCADTPAVTMNKDAKRKKLCRICFFITVN